MRIAMAVAVVLLVGCGGPKTFDTGADACFYIASIACGRDKACGTGGVTDVTACANSATSACCSNNACSKPVRSPELITTCGDEISAESCGQDAAGLLPSACVGVVARSQQ